MSTTEVATISTVAQKTINNSANADTTTTNYIEEKGKSKEKIVRKPIILDKTDTTKVSTCTIPIKERIKQAQAFFDKLYGNVERKLYGYLWVKRGNDKQTYTYPFEVSNDAERLKMAEQAIKLSDSKYDVYFGICGTDTAPDKYSRATTEQVTLQSCLWTDIDCQGGNHTPDKGIYPTIEQARTFLPMEPSILIRSGYGLHAYYLLNAPLELKTSDERDKARERNLNFINAIRRKAGEYQGAVDSVQDLSRVLRVPCTYNYKLQDSPALVEVLSLTDKVYSLNEFDKFKPVEELKASHNTEKINSSTRVIKDCLEKKLRIKYIEELLEIVSNNTFSERKDWIGFCCNIYGVVGVECGDETKAKEIFDRFSFLKTTADNNDSVGQDKNFEDIRKRTENGYTYSFGYFVNLASRNNFLDFKEWRKSFCYDFVENVYATYSTATTLNENELNDILYALHYGYEEKNCRKLYERFKELKLLPIGFNTLKELEKHYNALRKKLKKIDDDEIKKWSSEKRNANEQAFFAKHSEITPPAPYNLKHFSTLTLFNRGDDNNKYTTREDGINFVKTNKDGESYVKVCDFCYPLFRVKDYVSGVEKLKIISYSNQTKKWCTEIEPFDPVMLKSRKGLLELQAGNNNLGINEANAKLAIEYLDNVLIPLNYNKLPIVQELSQSTWVKVDGVKKFASPLSKLDGFIFDSKNSFFKCISTKGDFEEWKKSCAKVWDYPLGRFILSFFMSALMNDILSENPVAMYLHGNNSTGKTSIERFCISAVASPEAMKSFEDTPKEILRQAQYFSNFCMVIDEFGAVERLTPARFIFEFVSGKERGFLSQKREIRGSKYTWNGNLLMSGEEPFFGENDTPGAKKRTLVIEHGKENVIPVGVDSLAVELNNVSKKNYGWLGSLFIQHINNFNRTDRIDDDYRNKRNAILDKLKKKFPSHKEEHLRFSANACLTDEIIADILELKTDVSALDNTEKVLKNYVKNWEETDRAKIFWERLLGYILFHKEDFLDQTDEPFTPRNKFEGIFKKDGFFYLDTSGAGDNKSGNFRKWVEDNFKISFSSFADTLANAGYTERDCNGQSTCNTKFKGTDNGQRRCLKIRTDKIKNDTVEDWTKNDFSY